MAKFKSNGTVICIAGESMVRGQAVTFDQDRSGPPKAKPVALSGSFKVKLTAVSSTPPAALYEALTGEPFADRDVLVNGHPVRAHKLFDVVAKGMEK